MPAPVSSFIMQVDSKTLLDLEIDMKIGTVRQKLSEKKANIPNSLFEETEYVLLDPGFFHNIDSCCLCLRLFANR